MSNTYRNMLLEARRGGYAIPAFNYTDSWEFLAIMEAAEELNAPVYAASARNTVDAMGLDICGGLGGIAYKRSLGNLLNHLDHCSDVSRCKAAVDAGYHSVMYDGSALPLDENIQYSRMVSSYAKEHGVWMEGEVGQILGRTEEGRYSGGAYIARMEDCLAVTEFTSGLPLYIRIALAMVSGSEVSICNGRGERDCSSETTLHITDRSSISGRPTFTSRICAPASCWAIPSPRI